MIVNLAGYNLDINIIKQIQDKVIATPETISAAYARISRSKKSVLELRENAIKEVEAARKSNNAIIFEMGHSSIAEHAVFNFDILGISRFIVEFIQRSRLASYTEKSQRYVTLHGDYVTPEELHDTPLEKRFNDLIYLQNSLYTKIFNELKTHYIKERNPENIKDLENKAKEDARYVLSLATQTQMGLTINARNLTKMLRRLSTLKLKEADKLKFYLESQVKKVAPSLVKYTDAEDFEKNYLNHLPHVNAMPASDKFNLLRYPKDAENTILSILLFEKYGYDVSSLEYWVRTLTKKEKTDIFEKIFKDMKFYHSLPRAFETVDFTFQMNISASCFAQLKRHRMATVIKSYSYPNLDYIIPESYKLIDIKNELDDIMQKTAELYNDMEKHKKLLGNYILTNAHSVNVIFKANLRELYHFSRLRADSHAQWEIMDVANRISEKIKQILPNAGKYLMGKDEFISIKDKETT